jgi:NTP pyrophosphatase (non-canonical NTP hydrolase)
VLTFPNAMQNLADFQAFHRWFSERQGWRETLSTLTLNLVGEVGEVTDVLKKIRWRAQSEGEDAALAEFRGELGAELADVLAYLCGLANAAAIDLHAAYVAKMTKNLTRTWVAPGVRHEGSPADAPSFPNEMQTLPDFQAFHHWFDARNGWTPDLSSTTLNLVGEIGEVTDELKQIRWRAETEGEAAALAEFRPALGAELADVLAYLLKLANAAGIDLHDAYVSKMATNLRRTWAPPPKQG